MKFKTIPVNDATRISMHPLDYEWDTTISNGFIAATDEGHPRLANALEALNIHGAADLVIGAAEWCFARTCQNTDPGDGQLRLDAAWAASVDARYAALTDADLPAKPARSAWSRAAWLARDSLASLCRVIELGHSAKVRQVALGLVLQAEHMCGRDPAFGLWLSNMLRTKTASAPRRADDLDYTCRDLSPPTDQELTNPSREERLAGLDPASNPYLRSAADMAALGFVGAPYPQRH